MKQKLFILALAFFASITMQADPKDPVPLTPVVYTPGNNGQNPRSPILVPEFYQDGYTLTAGSYTVGSTVEVLDENDNVVYTAYVYVEGDTIVLPATLSGTYTIRVTRDGTTFVGEIEL